MKTIEQVIHRYHHYHHHLQPHFRRKLLYQVIEWPQSKRHLDKHA